MSSPVPDPVRDRQPIPAAAGPSSPVPSAPARAPFARVLSGIVPYLPAAVPAVMLIIIVVALVHASGFTNFGLQFFSLHFDPPVDQWGIAVFLIGSFLVAVPALFFSMLFGVGLAVASTAYLPKLVTQVLDPFVDLLAGIPSVVYGIWAFIIVAPYFGSTVEPTIHAYLGFLPGFSGPTQSGGTGIMLAVFILTLMALPITTLLIRDSLRAVPKDLWESGLALGATRWEVVRRVAIPYARRGIFSAAFLGFGRAFGETVAVAMVLGSATVLPSSVYAIGNTMAAEMFELLDSAYGNSQFLAALSEMAVVLLIISLVVNVVGRRFISRLYKEQVAGL